MERNKIDEIYSRLDEIKEENHSSFRRNEKEFQKDLITETRVVQKPKLPTIESWTSRYDYFEQMLNQVDYGLNNSETYIEGHKEALKRFLRQAKRNDKNLMLSEARLRDEMNEYSKKSKNNVYSKGYYDGLVYVYRALRKSKEALAKEIYDILKRELHA